MIEYILKIKDFFLSNTIIYNFKFRYFQIGALKLFAELGKLIEEDERNEIKFLDLPGDIIHDLNQWLTLYFPFL